MADSYMEQSLATLKKFEGCIPWMYRDTVGRITVGVGLMLPDAPTAESLPFRKGDRAATAAEIASDFDRVDALPSGRIAAFYRSPESLELAEDIIDRKLAAILSGFQSDLQTRFPRYDSFPDGVKMALLDMIYNLGPDGLFRGFPHLIAAIETESWAQAAECCLRRGPGPARNRWTQQQFLDAVVHVMKAEAENWWTPILRWLRHTFVRE